MIGLLLSLAACGDPKTPEDVADRFVDGYFVRADQEDALRWSTGRARRTLERELDLVRDVRAGGYGPEQAHPPTYFTRGAVRREGSRRVYVSYEVEIATGADGIHRAVEVSVERTRAEWRVSSFRIRDVR